MSDHYVPFTYAEAGMTRFPPNVEQVSVEKSGTTTWLEVRRNEVRLRFPLKETDCRHLASLLLGQAPILPGEDR